MNPYRRRVLAELHTLCRSFVPVERWLDFGSGDGWFAQRLVAEGFAREVRPVDVLRRAEVLVEPQLYDGVTLPFPDRSFDVSSAFDVLHHTPDPTACLREVLRCTARHFVVKDHTYTNELGRVTLGVLDELGNRRFGVPSNYRYQRAFEWDETLREAGFERREHRHPVRVHVGALGRLTNRLQYLSHWERVR